MKKFDKEIFSEYEKFGQIDIYFDRKLSGYLCDRLFSNIFRQCQNDIEGLKNVQNN